MNFLNFGRLNNMWNIKLDALRDLAPFRHMKNMKNTHGGVLLKITLLHRCFSSCTNRTKLPKASQMISSPSEGISIFDAILLWRSRLNYVSTRCPKEITI